MQRKEFIFNKVYIYLLIKFLHCMMNEMCLNHRIRSL